MPRKIIVNADDFGLSRQVNEAVIQAFRQDLISSASIITNMQAFTEAAQMARHYHLQHKIGVHLNLTEGKPLTPDIARSSRFCDAQGNWLPRRRVLRLNHQERLVLEAEIEAQIKACEKQGITPTHLDSHFHMHTEWGISPAVIQVAKRLNIGAVRLACNCGSGRKGASATHRILANAYRGAHNIRLRLSGLAKTNYFGDISDTMHILQTTSAHVEVMVHPMLDERGRLIDYDKENLESRIAALRITVSQMCSYYGL